MRVAIGARVHVCALPTESAKPAPQYLIGFCDDARDDRRARSQYMSLLSLSADDQSHVYLPAYLASRGCAADLVPQPSSQQSLSLVTSCHTMQCGCQCTLTKRSTSASLPDALCVPLPPAAE